MLFVEKSGYHQWDYIYCYTKLWAGEAPEFAHLSLILKPEGKGKLSKRDGAKFGFPVFPLDFHDKTSNEIFKGYREEGYFPEALIKFLGPIRLVTNRR